MRRTWRVRFALLLIALIAVALFVYRLRGLVRRADRARWTRTPAVGCGSDRWPVKTLSDHDSDRVLRVEARYSTIAHLSQLEPPSWSSHASRWPQEEMQYVIDGELLAYKTEADLDIHVIIGEAGATMLAEFPSPECIASNEARPELERARETLLTILSARPEPTLRKLPKPIPVRIRGVLFFDYLHGQSGAPANGAELHPVLEITRR